MAGCPVCGASDTRPLLRLEGLPVFCNVQYADPDSARAQPTADIALHFCAACRHFFNAAFQPELLRYGQHYENSLHYSATFSGFARDLAAELVERHGLRGVQIVDIGCGKGDFLRLLCELGDNEGHGFDPSYEAERDAAPLPEQLHFHAREFGPGEAGLRPRLVSCRQVLEHIWAPVEFLSGIVAALPPDRARLYYVEVPNALYTVRDLGIWDLIYEHCQYFSPASLAACAQRAGLSPQRLTERFGAQYLAMEAQGSAGGRRRASVADGGAAAAAAAFPQQARERLAHWRRELSRLTTAGPAVIWGAGSKGVTFANLVGAAERIAALVDINPHKQGRYVAGTGHRIVAPDALQAIDPAVVLVMNPLYTGEIQAQLGTLGLHAAVLGVS
ncbi:MAG: methyltransferase domain-containing protein [Gammaproteobacteria bacterium]|nr:MAG: methyltransferase domain-containing protein [Gammaproteobacteria bacterium]